MSDDTSASADPRVRAAIERLDELGDLPLDQHPQVYDAIHDRLREVLTGLDNPQERAQ